MNTFSERLRQVARRLARTPLFTIVTLITLAIAIGANAVIFSVINGILLKPLPYSHPEELVGVWHDAPGVGLKDANMAAFLYFTYREQSKTLADIGVYDGDAFSVTGMGQPEQVSGLDVTSRTLPLLGVQPALGRLFTERDDAPGSPETIVLSHDYWQQKFGGDRSAIGRVLTLDGRPRQIIGVLPAGFHFLDYRDAKIYMPLQWDRSKVKLGNFSQESIARLRPGVTMQQAKADLDRLIPTAIRSFPAPEGFSAQLFDKIGLAAVLHPLKQDVVGDIGNTLWIVMGSILMVLLIACANVANLLLVRVEGRRQELAVRSALGANRRQIALDLFLESALLGFTGSLLGLAIAYAALRILVADPAGLTRALPRLDQIGIDLPVLFFTLGAALLTSLLIGAIPVLKYTGSQINSGLREGGRSQSESRERHRARSVLVIVQVALAVVLLICSGLMIRTFRALATVDPGFRDPGALQTLHLYIPDTQIPDKESLRLVHTQQAIADKIRAIPGVTAVSYGDHVALDGSSNSDVLFAQDRTYAANELPPIRRFRFIAPGYLQTLGTPLIMGRDFSWDDVFNKLPVALISQNMAVEYWGSPEKAMHKRVRVANTDDWREIVGIVANVYSDGVSLEAPKTTYWPVLTGPFEGSPERIQRGFTLLIRSQRAGSQTFVKEIEQAVWSVDSDLPLANVRTLGEFSKRSMARTSFTLVMLSVAASMALLLGVVGIYGVISYSVSQRTREIGIRMALGAQRETITGLFVRNGLVLTGIGIASGLVASFLAARLMRSLLFHVSPSDPLTYISISAVIALVATLACYFPSRRAATVDPMHALRSE
ncbi:MAG TPA: ABC transporter permease [Acidobacteriaceae bacterium]